LIVRIVFPLFFFFFFFCCLFFCLLRFFFFFFLTQQSMSEHTAWVSFLERDCELEGSVAQKYATSFVENAVSLAQSEELTHELLREIGVTAVGHRMKVLKGVSNRSASTSLGNALATTSPIPGGASSDGSDNTPPTTQTNSVDDTTTTNNNNSTSTNNNHHAGGPSTTTTGAAPLPSRDDSTLGADDDDDAGPSSTSGAGGAGGAGAGAGAGTASSADSEEAKLAQLAQNFRKEFGAYEIGPNEIEVFELIGRGGYADVFRGRCRGEEVAVKVLHNKSLAADTRTEFMAEVKIMSQLYHPNIVLFLGGTFPAAQTGGAEPDKLVMVTQYMRGGSLLQLIEDASRPISLLQALIMARDTALGMNWLHSRNPCLLHLDLKPANLLIDEHGTVKVADFGISILVERGQVSKDSGRLRGSLPYMPPERLLQQPYDATADVYSFAMTVWQMLNRETPFSDLEKLFEQMNNMADFMVMFRRRVCQEHYRPPLKSTPPIVHDLITRCWDTSARERPQFSTLILEINGLIVAATIDDPAGRIFWRKQFMSKGKFQISVNYDRFIARFVKYFRVKHYDDRTLTVLRMLLARSGGGRHGTEHITTMQKFGHFANWFGPLTDSNGDDVVRRCIDLASYQPRSSSGSSSSSLRRYAFHGDITSTEAEQLLAGQSKGTFLIRTSTTSPSHPFVISKVSRQGAINHQRIAFDRAANFYSLEIAYDTSVQTVKSDIGETVTAFIEKVKSDLYLKNACAGSRFAAAFIEAVSDGYVAQGQEQ
jgi:serine/threonine protein kinase